MDINPSLQILGWYVKGTGLGKNPQKEWTRLLLAVQSESVCTRIPIFVCFCRKTCKYTTRGVAWCAIMAIDVYTRHCFSESLGHGCVAPDKRRWHENNLRVYASFDELVNNIHHAFFLFRKAKMAAAVYSTLIELCTEYHFSSPPRWRRLVDVTSLSLRTFRLR